MVIRLRKSVPRHQAGASHHAHRIDVKLAGTDTFGCQLVQIRYINLAPVTSEIGIPNVIGNDEQNVWAVCCLCYRCIAAVLLPARQWRRLSAS